MSCRVNVEVRGKMRRRGWLVTELILGPHGLFLGSQGLGVLLKKSMSQSDRWHSNQSPGEGTRREGEVAPSVMVGLKYILQNWRRRQQLNSLYEESQVHKSVFCLFIYFACCTFSLSLSRDGCVIIRKHIDPPPF